VDEWGGCGLKEKLKLKSALKDWHTTHTKNLQGMINSLISHIDVLELRGEVNVLSEVEVAELHTMTNDLHSLSRTNASIMWQQSRLLWL